MKQEFMTCGIAEPRRFLIGSRWCARLIFQNDFRQRFAQRWIDSQRFPVDTQTKQIDKFTHPPILYQRTCVGQ